ncbi:MAG TPA: hypothetical protein VGD11_09725 [Mycobacteriales bacterium]
MTRPTVPPTLTDEQLDDLRRDVEAGKRRRVVLLTDSAGLPAGGTGDVIRVGRPEVDGSDFVGVRIGGDELFFAPAELGLGGRRSAPKTTPARAAAKTGPAKPPADDAAAAQAYARAAAAQAGASTTPAKAAPVRAAASNAVKASKAANPTKPANAARPANASNAVKPANPTKATKAPARSARGGRKPPRLPAIAITIRSTDAGWTVEALRGGKAALKAAPVRAGTVQEIADALDESAVTAMVREVLDARRAVAASEAEELREALARAEAVLAEYEAGH